MANLPKPTHEPTKQSTKQPVEKQKEIRYAKALLKDKAEGTSAPYHFDILRITLYELLRLSKLKREALREALADAEAFMARILTEQRMKKTVSTPLNMPLA